MVERMSDKLVETGKQSQSLTDRVKALFSRPNNTVDVSKAEDDDKVMMSRRNFLKMGAGATAAVIAANAVPNIVKASGILTGDPKGITDPMPPQNESDGFPPKGHPVTENEKNDSHEKLQASIVIMGVPSATLTDKEKVNRDNLFATDKSNYAGLLDDLKIDNGKFTNLPFEAGSEADKMAQAFAPLAASMQNAGVKPGLYLAEDENQNIVGPTLTFLNTDKDFNLGKSAFKPGTGFEVFDGQIHYFQLTPRPDGETDKIMTIPVTQDLRDYVSQFYFEGQQLEISKDAKYLMAQVSAKGTIAGLISKDRPYFFVPIDEPGQSTATPQGPGAQLPPPQTAVPEEILAKTTVETAEQFDARMRETYKDLWISKDAKVKYVDSTHFSIDGKSFKVENPLNLGKIDGIVSNDTTKERRDFVIGGVFLGITNTRVIENACIQASDNSQSLCIPNLKVVDFAMLSKIGGKDLVLQFSAAVDGIYFQTHSADAKVIDIETILGKMTRGDLSKISLEKGVTSQQAYVDDAFKSMKGNIPEKLRSYLASMSLSTDEQKNVLQSLNDKGKVPSDHSKDSSFYIGPVFSILELK